jgi:5-methylcytosine-specific restriction endonuclease McrA
VTCCVDGCEKPVFVKTRQLCTTHYHRWHKHGDVNVVLKVASVADRSCAVPDCPKPLDSSTFCAMHYRRNRLYGDPLGRSTKYSAINCLECGAPIDVPATQIGWPPLHCSERCRYRRRSVRYGNRGMDPRYIEGVRRAEIFERDGWTCQLCHQPVDPTLTWPNRMMATIDHIIPVVRGGRHVRSNVRLAHLSCNTRRRDDNR